MEEVGAPGLSEIPQSWGRLAEQAKQIRVIRAIRGSQKKI